MKTVFRILYSGFRIYEALHKLLRTTQGGVRKDKKDNAVEV